MWPEQMGKQGRKVREVARRVAHGGRSRAWSLVQAGLEAVAGFRGAEPRGLTSASRQGRAHRGGGHPRCAS